MSEQLPKGFRRGPSGELYEEFGHYLRRVPVIDRTDPEHPVVIPPGDPLADTVAEKQERAMLDAALARVRELEDMLGGAADAVPGAAIKRKAAGDAAAQKPVVDEDTSDGYHTFKELYRYRMLYNAAFFNALADHTDIPVVKSHRHSDGEPCFGGGWFIVVAQLPTGQVSNHYEDKDWPLFRIPAVECAPKWDGHTPNDAADRIEAYLRETSLHGGNPGNLATMPRKGKWKNGTMYEYEYAYCSECGRMQWAGWETHKQAEKDIGSFNFDYKFCPGCGAEMEGGVYVK